MRVDLDRRVLARTLALSLPFVIQRPGLSADSLKVAPIFAPGITTSSGTRYYDLLEGSGPTPKWGQLIRFNFVTYYFDPSSGNLEECDSTYQSREPYFTKHGNGFTAQAVEEALHTMKVGGRRRVVIPQSLGFTLDKGPIPPDKDSREKIFTASNDGKPIVMDLELLAMTEDMLDRGDYNDGDISDLLDYKGDSGKQESD